MAGKKGRSGRRKLPAAVKQARGTYRKDRDADAAQELPLPTAAGSHAEPPKPEHLHAIAAAEWDRLTPLAVRVGLVTPLDWMAWRLGFWALSTWAEMSDRIGEPIHYTEKGYPVARPEIGLARQAWSAVKEFCREFGLTPSARSGLKLTLDLDAPADGGARASRRKAAGPSAETDPLEAMLG
jgi:P27 family predicted phage terminase small subunit